MRLCSEDLCRLMACATHLLAGLWSGCAGGSVALHKAALWQCLLISRWMGSVSACKSNKSMGVVCRQPVITSIPALCVVVSFDTAMLVPFLCGSVSSRAVRMPHMSTAYKTFGMATLL